MTSTSGFSKLPVEVAEKVIGCLAVEEPCSTKRIRQEPSIYLLVSESTPLKNVSLTCRSLRSLVFHLLFQFLRIVFDVPSPQTAKGDNTNGCLDKLHELSRFVSNYGLASRVRGLAFFFPVQHVFNFYYLGKLRHEFMSFTLEEMNPEFLTLIASPSVLGEIALLFVEERDVWAFGQNIHVLKLRQPRDLAGPGPNPKRISSMVFDRLYDLRPWSEITLNEGSCLSAYKTYEYHLKRTPSILQSNRGPTIPHVQHFEYVALFPLPSHMHELYCTLLCLPSLVSLSTQFTPASSAVKDILEDKERVGKASISDLWMETTRSYENLAKEIGAWSKSKKFRRWTSRDDRVDFDATVGPLLAGWQLAEPRTWERIGSHVDGEVSPHDD